MLKQTLAIAALVAIPSISSALTVNAENDYTAALALVNPADSLSLPGTWTAAPLQVSPDASQGGQYRSPYETAGAGHISAGYWTVGVGATYGGTSNPAELALNGLSNSMSLFWGSPDSYNKLELYNGATLIATVLGSQFNIPALEASFVTLTSDDATEYFDSVKFYSDNANAFEFSNLAASPVPLPASGLLLIGGLGALVARSRRKAKQA